VSDVISLGPERIKPAPEFGAMLNTQYILGLVTLDDHMIIAVNIEKLLSAPEMQLIGDAGSAVPDKA